MREDDAYRAFCALRWPDGVRCPRCGNERVYPHRKRQRFVCASPPCRRQFSATTATVFASRKLSYAQLMEAIDSFRDDQPIVATANDMGVQFKSAYVLARKLHELKSRGIEGKSDHVGYWQRSQSGMASTYRERLKTAA